MRQREGEDGGDRKGKDERVGDGEHVKGRVKTGPICWMLCSVIR